ncbi:putative forkhead protein/ forkhead protein domain [Fasciolopsis buskii]|uniref:Putative forkhead protein/ forkhead protein domain n=1 Tax=Fasciolopsis buskii TaxID=27845 RepID=A0A8E0RRP7_9TREM|nr:putative forkhead protein/ forkhead protein domain [Fasciolopsis buski]
MTGVQDSISKVAYVDSVAQENLWLQILRQTNEKLEDSIKMVENQLDSIQDEGNEWKTRFELQKEINEYYKKAFFICDQHVPKAKMILRMINRATRRGSRITDQLDLDEDPIEVMDSYTEYIRRLCKELENRVDQEGKAYYWATDLRKRALIELNYTYVPAPAMKTSEEKTNKAAEMSLARRLQRSR